MASRTTTRVIREEVSFKIWKKGSKWIQCYVNFTDNNEKKSLNAKVLITSELKKMKEGDYISNLPAEIKFTRDEYTLSKDDIEVYPLKVDNSSYVFKEGIHKFKNINEVAKEDLFYIVYLSSLENLEKELKESIEFLMKDFTVRTSFQKFDAFYRMMKFDYEEVEGYCFVEQNVIEVKEEDRIKITNLYKKI